MEIKSIPANKLSEWAKIMGRKGGLKTAKLHPEHAKEMVNKRWEKYRNGKIMAKVDLVRST